MNESYATPYRIWCNFNICSLHLELFSQGYKLILNESSMNKKLKPKISSIMKKRENSHKCLQMIKS